MKITSRSPRDQGIKEKSCGLWPIVVGDTKWGRVIKIWGIHSPEWRCQPRAPVVTVIPIKTWTYETWLNTPRGSLTFGVLCVQFQFYWYRLFLFTHKILDENNWYLTKCGCLRLHRANLVTFLYSFLYNFSYFRGIWFLFNVNNHRDKCIEGLLKNAIWFIWKDNLGRFQRHDLPPLDI